MENDEQIMLIRAAYLQQREVYMKPELLRKAAAAALRDPKKYEQERALLHGLSVMIENALLRGECARAVRYLVVFSVRVKDFCAQIEEDCKAICKIYMLPI